LSGIITDTTAVTVKVTVNSKTYDATVAEDGSWTVTIPDGDALGEGSYDITVVATDAAGNETTASLIDSGFRPKPDGYNFSNYHIGSVFEYSIFDLRSMFGDDNVCFITVGDFCTPRFKALMWMNEMNSKMLTAGHCVGMSVTSLRFFDGTDDTSEFTDADGQPANNTYLIEKDRSVDKHIAYHHVLQKLSLIHEERTKIVNMGPEEFIEELGNNLEAGNNPVVNIWMDETKGHAVVAYALIEEPPGYYTIKVYDSSPEEVEQRSRSIQFYPEKDTFAYHYQDWEVVDAPRGNNLEFVPLSIYKQALNNAADDCPWCNSGSGASLSAVSTGEVWYSGNYHLLISDSQGQRIGFVGDTFVNEYPGASITRIAGGMAGVEPVYSLPLNEATNITVGDSPINYPEDVYSSEQLSSTITQFGPNYAVSAGNVVPQDQLTIASDGMGIAYTAHGNNNPDLSIALDSADEGYHFQIQDVDLETGKTIQMNVDPEQGTLSVDNSQGNDGSYDLEIQHVDATGEYTFTEDTIDVAVGDTHHVDYGTWDGGTSITIRIDEDSDGTIEETITLGQQEIASITLQSSAKRLPADAQSTTVITATVLDIDNNPLPDTTVTFSTTLGTITPASATTNEQGIATATLTADENPGTATVFATIGKVQATLDVAFEAEEPQQQVASIALQSSSKQLPADGQSTTIITATVLDLDNSSVPNATVTFSTTLGTITPATVPTDQQGIASANLTAAMTSGTATIFSSVGKVQATLDIVFEDEELQKGTLSIFLPIVQR
jgi:hypothetical protein